jgi:hypothetical protein
MGKVSKFSRKKKTIVQNASSYTFNTSWFSKVVFTISSIILNLNFFQIYKFDFKNVIEFNININSIIFNLIF